MILKLEMYVTKVRERYSFGFTDWRGLFGTEGACIKIKMGEGITPLLNITLDCESRHLPRQGD